MGPRKKHLGPLRALLNVKDVGSKPLPLAITLSGNLFLGQKNRFRSANADIEASFLHPLNASTHQVSLSILKFIIDILSFSVSHLLDNHLLRRLGSNPTKVRIE